jgi:putative ABC transport system ATP-binding protein
VKNGSGNAVETMGLRKVYGEGSTAVRALDDVSLEFPNGEFAAIMGPSGSGKSTLLHILGALDRPTGGRVVVGGTDLSGLSDRELTLLRRERMGFVFQFFNLIPTLSAEENVLLPVLISGKKPGKYERRLDELLDLVGLTGRARTAPTSSRRRAAAGRHSPRPHTLPRHHPRRRADRQPGLQDRRRGARPAQGVRRPLRADHPHGHPRPPRRRAADRALFLSDGRVVDEARNPNPDDILERIRTLESPG